MTRTFFNLPLEVHRAIFNLLLYPDLTRLRATCRELRQIDDRDIIKGALVQLERDWLDAVFAVEENKTNGGIHTRKQNVLECWGYAINDTDKIEQYLPCYECLQLRKLVAHFSSDYLSVLAKHAAALARSYQQPLQVPATRHCIDCTLESSKYLDIPGGRWLCVLAGPGGPGGIHRHRYWLAICRICNTRVETIEPPKERQRHSDLCSTCLEKSHAEWCQFQHDLQQRKEGPQQQVATISTEIDVLSRCSSWMTNVDNGRSVVDNRPKDLDGITMPKWEEIRPDALVKLPRPWESRH